MSERDNGQTGGKKALKAVVEVVICLLIAVLLVGLVQQFFLAPIGVVGISMQPTINENGDTDKVYVQKKGAKIKRGDVIVFYRPNSDDAKESDNPAKKFSIADFFNSLPFVNKFPKSDEGASSKFVCVIKRVIGIPGDVIKIDYNDDDLLATLYRNGKKVNDGFAMVPKSRDPSGVEKCEYTVGEGQYFVLGDNRNHSHDSEDYGPIQQSWVMGKVVLARINGKWKRSL